jgi:hypothetical protein
MFRSAGFSLLRAEGFSWSLEVLSGGLGISNLQFLIKNITFFSCKFFYFFVIKTLDPDWIRIQIGLFSLKCWIRIRNNGKRPTFFALRHISSPVLPVPVVIMAFPFPYLSLYSLCVAGTVRFTYF